MGEQEHSTGQGKKPLVSVERQTEQNLFTGERIERRFVKMYFEARQSGLLADIPDELWKTLCVLATYIDDQGCCFPSQETIARDLGIGRQAVNGRIRRLREYRFQGQPVLSVARPRARSRKGQTRYGSNVYQLLPIAGFVFGTSQGPGKADESSMSPKHDNENYGSMSLQHDIDDQAAPDDASTSLPMSPSISRPGRHEQERTRVERDTHTTRETSTNDGGPVCVVEGGQGGEEQKQAMALVRSFHARIGAAKGRAPSERELEHAWSLIDRLGVERARYVVAHALREAGKTRFQMRHFGAVMAYEADAEEGWRHEQQRRVRDAQDERRRREEQLRDRYYRWRAQVLEEAIQAMDPADREVAEAKVAAELEREQGRQRFGFKTLVRLNLAERLAAERGIPPFEEWQREEYPRLREAGFV